MKNDVSSSSRSLRHILGWLAGVAAIASPVSLAAVFSGQMLGDLVLFLLIGFVKPAAFVVVGVALYRSHKRRSRFVQLSPPFTPLEYRS